MHLVQITNRTRVFFFFFNRKVTSFCPAIVLVWRNCFLWIFLEILWLCKHVIFFFLIQVVAWCPLGSLFFFFFWSELGFFAVCTFSCAAACGILVPRPGIEPLSPALQDGFLTTGPLGKVPPSCYWTFFT